MNYTFNDNEDEQIFNDLVDLVNDFKEEAAVTGTMSSLRYSAFPDDWDFSRDVMGLQMGVAKPAYEGVDEYSMADLLGPDKMHRKVFYRITLCFSSLMAEMDSLVEEEERVLLPPLVLYGESSLQGGEELSDEEAHVGFVNLLHHFEIIWFWCKRVEEIVCYAVRQLAGLFCQPHQTKHSVFYSYMEVSFMGVWKSLAALLGAVIHLEEVIQQNEVIRQGFQYSYQLLAFMSTYKGDQLPIQSKATMLNDFQSLLRTIRNEVLNGTILRRIASLRFDTTAAGTEVVNNNVFFTTFSETIHLLHKKLDPSLNYPHHTSSSTVLGLLGLHYLYQAIFTNGSSGRVIPSQRKEKITQISEKMLSLPTRFPVLLIEGVYTIRLSHWMAQHDICGALATRKEELVRIETQVLETLRRQWVADLPRQMKHWTTLISVWMADLQTTLPITESSEKQFIKTVLLLMQKGLQLSGDLRGHLVQLLGLYQNSDNARLNISVAYAIAQGVELLNMIRSAFHAKLGVIGGSFNVLAQSAAYVMEKNLYNIFLRLEADLKQQSRSKKAPEAEAVDLLDAVTQAILLLHKPYIKETLIALDVVLTIALNRKELLTKLSLKNVISRKEYDDIFSAYSQLKRVAKFQVGLWKNTDCSFIYWYRDVLYPQFIARYFKLPERAPYLVHLLAAMQDACDTLLKAKHTEDNTQLLKAYKTFVYNVLQKELIQPICSNVENHIRLHTHTIVMSEENPRRFGEDGNPSSHAIEIVDVSGFLHLAPISFFSSWFDIKTQVEHYLSQQFYNLNALAPKDWKIYSEMRHLAKKKYGLHTIDGRLPGSVVDQGLDVLAVTENIHVFISNYTYNINEQIFIQRGSCTETKHLQTLQVRHVANSVRTHGTGILHTAVNYVYRCLLKKLSILSQFLNNEQIKSRLVREAKFVQKQKENHKLEYPYSRAEQLVREVQKLGTADDGNSFLFKFTQLVGEIGNTLGFMRLMRSGGLRAIADAAIFLPTLNSTAPVSLSSCLEENKEEEENADFDVEAAEAKKTVEILLKECTVDSSRHVDQLSHIIAEKISDGSDFFQLLQDALGKKLRTAEKYNHLRLFYLLIPSMSLVFTEYLVKEKELLKKNKEGVFTDDGFALGCSFLVSLFGVQEPFQSLHWFETVRQRFVEYLDSIELIVQGQKAPSPRYVDNETGHRDTAHLTKAIVEMNLRQYVELEEAFISTKVFFYKYNSEFAANEDELDDLSDVDDESTDYSSVA